MVERMFLWLIWVGLSHCWNHPLGERTIMRMIKIKKRKKWRVVVVVWSIAIDSRAEGVEKGDRAREFEVIIGRSHGNGRTKVSEVYYD